MHCFNRDSQLFDPITATAERRRDADLALLQTLLQGVSFARLRVVRRLGRRTRLPGFYGVNSAVYQVTLIDREDIILCVKVCRYGPFKFPFLSVL